MNPRLLFLLACFAARLDAAEVHGQLELRLGSSDTAASWTRSGLGKTQFDRDIAPLDGLRGTLRFASELPANFTAIVHVNANGDRGQVLDLQEAWLGFNPVPTNPWRTRMRLGSFFPPTSLEVAYDSVAWTPTRTLSSSAINSWIGEEFRTNGLEVALLRRGAFASSPHDFGVTFAIFGANDPAGTLLAWRGWSLGDRISGLTETLRLADLPVYRPDGAIPLQTRWIHDFRELDGRPGFYGALNYAHARGPQLALLHYDSRADPLRVTRGQYSWRTRFNHLSVRIPEAAGWELLFQTMRGTTMMGNEAVHLRYAATYLLAGHDFGPGHLALRIDHFQTTDIDATPGDPNGERGHAFTLAYRRPLAGKLEFVSEALYVDSNRAARALIGEDSGRIERRLSAALRWGF